MNSTFRLTAISAIMTILGVLGIEIQSRFDESSLSPVAAILPFPLQLNCPLGATPSSRSMEATIVENELEDEEESSTNAGAASRLHFPIPGRSSQESRSIHARTTLAHAIRGARPGGNVLRC